MTFKEVGKVIERKVRAWFRDLPAEEWEHLPYVSEASPLIIGGCGRSGTTILSAILNAHPNLYCGPESRLLSTPSLNPKSLAHDFEVDERRIRTWLSETSSKFEFAERFFRELTHDHGKGRWSEKTPGNILVLDRLFASFPKAKFIHAIRDGRDNVCSNRTHPKYKLVRGKQVETGILRPIDDCAERWVRYVSAGLAYRDDPRYHEVKYEDVVNAPEETARRLFEFIEEPWDDRVLEFHEGRGGAGANGTDRPMYTSALSRWERDFSDDDKNEFKKVAGDLLIELGYTEDSSW